MSRYRTVIAGIDFNALADVVLDSASRVAELVGAERLHLVHATQPWSWPGPLALDHTMSETWDKLIALAHEELEALPVPATCAQVTRETLGGPAARELVRAATLVSADLIVVATAGRGAFQRAVLGSVASTLIRAAPCPILVAGEQRSFAAPKHIVAAIDLAPIAAHVLRHAAAFAELSDADVTVVSAYDFERALAIQRDAGARGHFEGLPRVYRNAVADRVHEVLDSPCPVHVEVVPIDPPARAILEAIDRCHAELVVLGTSGHSAWHRMLLGSTASRIISEAPCAVLVVPARMETS